MNADLKQQIEDVLAEWHNSDDDLFSFEETGDRMAALLQELADAPEAEPFAVIHLDGSFVHVEFKQTIAGTGKFEVYAAPPAPSVPDGWRGLCRRLYVELFHCDKQITNTYDDDGEPVWRTGATVRAVLDDAKTALDATPTQPEPPADVVRDAARWQMLPAFLAEFQVPYLQLVDKIDAAIEREILGGGND